MDVTFDAVPFKDLRCVTLTALAWNVPGAPGCESMTTAVIDRVAYIQPVTGFKVLRPFNPRRAAMTFKKSI